MMQLWIRVAAMEMKWVKMRDFYLVKPLGLVEW